MKSTASTATVLLATASILSSCPSTLAFAPCLSGGVESSSSIPSAAASLIRSPGPLRPLPLRATIAVAELDTMDKQERLTALGVVDEEKLALGISPEEVLELIGTRDDIIAKFQADIPSYSLAEASAAADSFLMDGEMLDVYIKYSQRKIEDPNWEPQYAEEPSPVATAINFVSQYGIWLVGGILLRDLVTEFMGKNGGGGEEVLVSRAMEGIHLVSNTLA